MTNIPPLKSPLGVQNLDIFNKWEFLFQKVSKWGSKIAGLVVVEPGISSSSFKEWGEGKVRILMTNHQLCLVAFYLLVFLFLKN